jgi:hypothetical protein
MCKKERYAIIAKKREYFKNEDKPGYAKTMNDLALLQDQTYDKLSRVATEYLEWDLTLW